MPAGVSTAQGAGWGNHVETEAVPGALPTRQNSPQHVPYGLYCEQFSGTAFTAPRTENRRSWLYRLRPSADHRAYAPYHGSPLLCTAPFESVPVAPNRLRWDPLSLPEVATDFVDGLITFGGNGDVRLRTGVALHQYAANGDMQGRAFFSADGELLIVPRQGRLRLTTELGILDVEPLQIALLPRGLRFSAALLDGTACGYVCENYGPHFRLPELGPIGSNGLANARDFSAPQAWYEDSEQSFEIVQKFHGNLWSVALPHSPFDVVAWQGNLTPYVYDLRRFNTINTVSFDHPDPSIFTVLTSPTEAPGVANCDFVIFPPRWMVAENTFRPPWFHRNTMSEFMGLIQGQYDAKAGGFAPGGASLHNCMNAHGPDRASYEAAVGAELTPKKIEDTMAFMFETHRVIEPTRFALGTPLRQKDYDACWSEFRKARLPS